MGDRSVATCYRVWCGGGLRGWRCEQMAVRRGWNATPAAAYSPGGRRNHGHGQVTIAEDDVLTREGLQAFLEPLALSCEQDAGRHLQLVTPEVG
jgi:hypothetical protein